MDSMRSIMTVIHRTMSSFAYVAMLLALFVFIFSVLGMQLFGGKLLKEDKELYGDAPLPWTVEPRNHFDSLHWYVGITHSIRCTP